MILGRRPWHTKFEQVVLKDGTVLAVWVGHMQYKGFPTNIDIDREGMNGYEVGNLSAEMFGRYEHLKNRVPFALQHREYCENYFVGIGTLPQGWEDSRSCWGTEKFPWRHVYHGDKERAEEIFEEKLVELMKLAVEEVEEW